jgi:hypothetical protein
LRYLSITFLGVKYLFKAGLALLLFLPFGELTKRLKLLRIIGYDKIR